MTDKQLRAKLRRAVADYIGSEGCSFCECPDHKEHGARLAELLNIKKYNDGSGYDFSKYETGVDQ